jgi:Protein of unknown function (DUF1190)
MTRKKKQPKDLQLLQNHRKIVYVGLAISGIFTILIVTAIVMDTADMTEAEANAPIKAIFYQNTAQCEADINKQQAEYAVLLKKYEAKQLEKKPTMPLDAAAAAMQPEAGQPEKWPTPPPLEVRDCAPQMLAAQQEHDKTAPVYASIADCQAEGVQCEATPASAQIAGYRPVYGGTYIDPYYDDPSYTYINYGGTQHRIYESRPVYQSLTSGRVVTPYGREISQLTTGTVTVPRHASFAAPERPTGTSGSGTIRGRSTQGFGSSFKSTGSGGK